MLVWDESRDSCRSGTRRGRIHRRARGESLQLCRSSYVSCEFILIDAVMLQGTKCDDKYLSE